MQSEKHDKKHGQSCLFGSEVYANQKKKKKKQTKLQLSISSSATKLIVLSKQYK